MMRPHSRAAAAREPILPGDVQAAMKGTPRSLILSAANRAAGWWMGHAANAMRRGQAAWVAAATKAAAPKRRPRKRKPR
jgi:hypothetical protein